jgi:hypothetical protein
VQAFGPDCQRRRGAAPDNNRTRSISAATEDYSPMRPRPSAQSAAAGRWRLDRRCTPVPHRLGFPHSEDERPPPGAGMPSASAAGRASAPSRGARRHHWTEAQAVLETIAASCSARINPKRGLRCGAYLPDIPPPRPPDLPRAVLPRERLRLIRGTSCFPGASPQRNGARHRRNRSDIISVYQ